MSEKISKRKIYVNLPADPDDWSTEELRKIAIKIKGKFTFEEGN